MESAIDFTKIESYLFEGSIDNLRRASDFSKQRLLEISEIIQSSNKFDEIEEAGLGFAVSGSLGRSEALGASDVDFITLCPEGLAEASAQNLDRYIRNKIREKLRCDVSKGENFTGPTYLRDISSARCIGGEGDNVNLLTKRILLLTESQPIINFEIRNAFQREILNAFLSSSSTKRRYLASITDEIVRYYRTLCIDYKSRVDWEMKSWAPRYLRLRCSRKYWFFSLIMAITALLVKFEARPEIAEPEIEKLLNQSPTMRIFSSVEYAGIPSQLATVAMYDKFLGKMKDVEIRKIIDSVEYSSRHNDECFQELKRNADRLHRAMLETIESLPANWRRHILGGFLLHS